MITLTPNTVVAVYCRVSSDEQATRGTIGIQKEAAERYIVANSLTLAGIYADDGVSGTIPFDLRPEGVRLLRDARAGRFKTLLIWKLDRLGRDPGAVITMTALQTLYQCGVTVVSLTEAVDLSTPEGWFMAVMLAGAAGLERSNILRRSMAGQERLAREGIWLGGSPPYGYRLAPDRRLVINDNPIPDTHHSEPEVIRMLFEWVAVERLSTQKCAERLTSLGIPVSGEYRVRRGPKARLGWTGQRVYNLIVDTVYRGAFLWGKNPSNGKMRDIIAVEVPAIVSPDRWRAAQEAMAANAKFAARNARTDYLLRGLIRCACGCSYVGSQGRKGEQTWRYYTCNAKSMRAGEHGARGEKCPSKPLNADEIESAVWADVEGFLRDPGQVITKLEAHMEAELAEGDDLHQRLLSTQEALRRLTQEKDAVVGLFRKGRIDEATLNRQLDDIQANEGALRDVAGILITRLRDADAYQQQLFSVETLLRTLGRRLDAPIDFATKRAIVENLVKGIRVETTIEGEAKKAVPHVTYVFAPKTSIGISAEARG